MAEEKKQSKSIKDQIREFISSQGSSPSNCGKNCNSSDADKMCNDCKKQFFI